jgi:MerR family copper efflux transcriptional regulator
MMRAASQAMNISGLARASGVPAKTIRYNEGVGLIPPAARSPSGYRRYDRTDVARLKFIHRARGLGFSVAEVATLLALWGDKGRASAEVKALALRHVAQIDRKIEELRSIRHTLHHLAEQCHGDARPDCPILDDLAGTG